MKANRWYIEVLMIDIQLTTIYLIKNNNLEIKLTRELLREVQDLTIKQIKNIKSKKELKELNLDQIVYKNLATAIMGA